MKLTPISPKKLVKVLGFLGYSQVRQKGSHIILEHKETRKITVVPMHSGQDISVGLLSMILREVGLSREEYFKLLRKA
ncbi:addiction module toxin, HicA family [Candidatus Micrarchaeota archaeon]|nr:addiction module toxin, HicA family [Candidatus Micrarchaeota archaeon]MBD3417410.1 addiction module toxin, HicA family [Candidatus Micrarchaeota archaeon]